MSGDSFEMPEGMPEGMPDFVKMVLVRGAQQQREAVMHAEDFDNRWYDLLQNATVEQLMTLREVLNYEPDSARLNYLDGMVASVLRLQHQVCSGCGKDHTQEGLDTVLASGAGTDPRTDPRADPRDGEAPDDHAA